ncbi:major facilitator superfamily domain-containing protein [Cunninghamella echinulata]|nr:major facilitator superfamily domain-containing protein [Cunninghamella echinulata]
MEEHDIEGKTSWVAWLQVAIVVGITSSSALMWMTATSSPQVSAEYFNVNLSSVNWLSNVSAIITAIFSIPAGWCYEKFGIKISLIIAAATNVLGCWIRCIAITVPTNQKYTVMMAGQVIASIGGPLGKKKKKVTGLFINFNLYIFSCSTWYLFIIAGIATIVAIPTPFLPSKPKIPPTKTSAEERMEFFTGCKKLLKNGPFWWGAFFGSLALGAAYTYGVLIMQAITPYGYTDEEAGICASIMVASGFVGGFLPNAYGSIVLVCIVNGFFTWGIVPVFIEFCSEVTYPIPESITSCVIFTFGTVFMFIFSVLVDSLRAGPDATVPNNMTNSLIAMAAIMCGCFLPVFWLKGDMKRLAADIKV